MRCVNVVLNYGSRGVAIETNQCAYLGNLSDWPGAKVCLDPSEFDQTVHCPQTQVPQSAEEGPLVRTKSDYDSAHVRNPTVTKESFDPTCLAKLIHPIKVVYAPCPTGST